MRERGSGWASQTGRGWRGDPARGGVLQQDIQRGRERRGAAVLNIGCTLLELHKRVLLDNSFQSFKRNRGKLTKHHIYLYICSHLNNLPCYTSKKRYVPILKLYS